MLLSQAGTTCRGCPRKANSTAYPFAQLVSATPRQRVPRLPSSYAAFEPHEPFGTCGRDQRYVRPTSAIPHFKEEHPYFARLPTRCPELPPSACRSAMRFTPQSPLRPAIPTPSPAFLVPTGRMGRRASDVSVTAQVCAQLEAGSTRTTETASPSYRVNATADAARDAFLWWGALLGPFAGLAAGVSPAGASALRPFAQGRFESPLG